MTRYTFKEAEAAAEKINCEWKRFCPVIKDMCRTDCHCFRRANSMPRDVEGEAWRVIYPGCNHKEMG